MSKVQVTDKILQDDEFDLKRKARTWDHVTTEVRAEVYDRTIDHIINNEFEYKKYLAYINRLLSDWAKADRQKKAKVIFKKYHRPKNSHFIRFSNEVYFGYGFEKQLWIIWHLGTRYHHDYIHHQLLSQGEEKYRKRKHCYAFVEYKFKLAIIFINLPSNMNGKPPYSVYIDYISKPIVKPWIIAGKILLLKMMTIQITVQIRKNSYVYKNNKMVLRVISIL